MHVIKRKTDKQSRNKQGIDQAQIDGANKGVANIKKQAGQTATKVPGQKAPVAQVDKLTKMVKTIKLASQ